MFKAFIIYDYIGSVQWRIILKGGGGNTLWSYLENLY